MYINIHGNSCLDPFQGRFMIFDPFIFLIRNNIMHWVTCKTFMIVIIVNFVHYNNGGCDVNDW